jgi:hypothetical protein
MTERNDDKPGTFPPVDALPDVAAYELLTTFAAMSESQHPGARRWAGGVFAALVGRLTQVEIVDAGPEPLSVLSTAELRALQEFFGHEDRAFHDDPDVASWYRKLFTLLRAEPDRRELQDAVDRAVLLQLDCAWTPPPVPASRTSDLPPWSEVSRRADDGLTGTGQAGLP